MKRATWTAVSGCAIALLLAGCTSTVTGQASPAAGQAGAPASASHTAPSGTPRSTASSTASSATGTPTTPAGQPHGPSGLLGFTTPSGNIACYVTSGTPGDPTDPGEARCDVAEDTWNAPPPPASCAGDWGHSVTVGPGGATLACVTDSAANDNVVAYGTTQVRGAFSCSVAQTGVTCTDLDTGHGFAVASAQYRLF